MIDFIHILTQLNFYALHINAERFVNLAAEHLTVTIDPAVDPEWLSTVESYLQDLAYEGGYHRLWVDVAYTPFNQNEDNDDGYGSAT